MANLEEKLSDLKKQREQLIANVNAIAGAIQLCEQLIAEEKEDAKAVPSI